MRDLATGRGMAARALGLVGWVWRLPRAGWHSQDAAHGTQLLVGQTGADSCDDFVKEGETYWDGVRNYQARNNLRAMKTGDHVFFYHSVSDKEVVGVAKVTKEHYPDPTAMEGDWSVVDLAAAKPMKKPVSLAQIKAEKSLENIALIKQSRLSVMPITEPEFRRMLELGETKMR